MDEGFAAEMTAGYATEEPSVVLGSPMLDGEILSEIRVGLPLSSANRQGLVAGATGTARRRPCSSWRVSSRRRGCPLMEQIGLTARLIRSKGVGVYFVTRAPTDVPSSVLSQLGNRIQHALRAFTPQDADDLRKTARTFPSTEHYDVEEAITSLGIGEALITVLSPTGVPSPLAATRLIPPTRRCHRPIRRCSSGWPTPARSA